MTRGSKYGGTVTLCIQTSNSRYGQLKEFLRRYWGIAAK